MNSPAWYFHGVEVKMGNRVQVNGHIWQVVGIGTTPGGKRIPYLWLQHDQFGTMVYAPALHPVQIQYAPQYKTVKPATSQPKELMTAA